MTRGELPGSQDAERDGGYIVFPRRIAIGGIILMSMTLGVPAISFYVADQAQERRLIEVERRLLKAEDRAEQDRGAIAEIRVDVRVVRQLLEGKPPR